jgi:hypothetical protein
VPRQRSVENDALTPERGDVDTENDALPNRLRRQGDRLREQTLRSDELTAGEE